MIKIRKYINAVTLGGIFINRNTRVTCKKGIKIRKYMNVVTLGGIFINLNTRVTCEE